MNDPFLNYTKKLESEVQIKPSHKKALAQELFKPQKKPFWTWTKAIFTAPVVATIALVFLFSSNQETVKQVLQPQEALAQALENTFAIKASETLFGLPLDDKLRQRSIIFKIYNDQNAAYDVSKFTYWVQNLNTRVDTFDGYPWSELFNEKEQFICFTQKHQLPQCLSHEELNNQSEYNPHDVPNFRYEPRVEIIHSFFPESKENFIEIIDFEKVSKNQDDPMGYITFTTAQSLQKGRILFSPSLNSDLTSLEFDEIFSDDTKAFYFDENVYFNQLKGGKYYHQVKLGLYDRTFQEYKKMYFQIQDLATSGNLNTLSSVVYEIDTENNDIQPIDFDGLYAGLQKFILETGRQQGPLIYILDNLNELHNPLNVEEHKDKGKNIKKLVYPLDKNYFAKLDYVPYGLKNKANYFIDITIDTEEMLFIGYSLREDDLILESLEIEDKVLPNEAAERIFNDKEKWLEEYLQYDWHID